MQIKKTFFENKNIRISITLLFLSIVISLVFFIRSDEFPLHPSTFSYETTHHSSAEIFFKRGAEYGLVPYDWSMLTNYRPKRLIQCGENKISYRGVILCNNANYTDKNIKLLRKYFRQNVAEDYRDYYSEAFPILFQALICGVSVWALIILALKNIHWVNKGKCK